MATPFITSPGLLYPDPEAKRLVAKVALVRLGLLEALLEVASAARKGESTEAAESAVAKHDELSGRVVQEALQSGVILPEIHIAARYELTPFELDVLWLSCAPRLDPELRRWIGRANNNNLHNYVDSSLALLLFCGTRGARLQSQDLLSPLRPLFASGLLRRYRREFEPTNPLLHELVPTEHLVAFMRGERALSSIVGAFGDWVRPTVDTSQVEFDARLERTLLPAIRGYFDRSENALEGRFGPGGMEFSAGAGILLYGPSGSGRTFTLKAICGDLGRNLVVLDGARLGRANERDIEDCLATVCQEADIHGELVVVRRAAALVSPGHPGAGYLADALRKHQALVVLCTEQDEVIDANLEDVLLVRQEFKAVERADSPGRVWELNLPPGCSVPDGFDFDTVATKINLTNAQVRKASQLAMIVAPLEEHALGNGQIELLPRISDQVLENAARAQVFTGMGPLVRAMDPRRSLDDLILPPECLDQIKQVLSAARARDMVLRKWRLGEKITRGHGISCLFDGDPGTGKTLSAEVIAAELELKLMRVNIAGIVDKYIGETEKHLTRLFEEARPDLTLLLFDEADSLFSKRTEVKASNDRYSNMNINVLLQLIEEFEGVTVLTTNLKSSLDKAFERRITFKVSFPVPEAPQREKIWEILVPDRVPTSDEVDFERLSEIELAGGAIKNAVLRAAYTAAHEGELLSTEYLIEAAVHEAAAEGRLVRGDYQQDFY